MVLCRLDCWNNKKDKMFLNCKVALCYREGVVAYLYMLVVWWWGDRIV